MKRFWDFIGRRSLSECMILGYTVGIGGGTMFYLITS